MGRTKDEVAALTFKIVEEVKKKQERNAKLQLSNAKKVFNVHFKGDLEKFRSLSKKLSKKAQKYASGYFNQENKVLIGQIANKLAKIKKVSPNAISNDIILASDQGADVLIKKIVEQYV